MFQIESVEYRSTPHARLSQAEQSIPVLVELPPQRNGMFSIDAARDRISPRIVRDGSATAASKTGAGGVDCSIASGPFAFIGSAVKVASDERSGMRTLGHSSSSAKKRTTTTRSVLFAK